MDNPDPEEFHISCFHNIMLFNETNKHNETIVNAHSVITLFNTLAKEFDVLHVQEVKVIKNKAD